MNNISEHITYAEATKTSTGLLNEPDNEQLIAMKNIADKLFEPLRGWHKKPIIINSFFRSKPVNKAVGGAKNSQHTRGEAIDIRAADKRDNKILFFYIFNSLEFDQLIWEKGNTDSPNWIHVSLKVKGKNRKQVIYNI